MWDDRDDSPDDVRENLNGVEDAELERAGELTSAHGEFDVTPDDLEEPSSTLAYHTIPLWEE